MKQKLVQAFLVTIITIVSISCSLFGLYDKEEPEAELTSLSLDKSSVSMSIGSIEYISLTALPAAQKKDVELTWTYDKTIISCETSTDGVIISSLKAGITSLKVTGSGLSSVCIVTVTGDIENPENITQEPYIYSNTSIIEMQPNTTQKVNVSLYGGTVADIDGYTWTIDNSNIASLASSGQYCIITSLAPGSAKITVRHTKASYAYTMLVCVYADTTKSTYITTAQNIVTLNKDEGENTISVSLVNPITENYSADFTWTSSSDTIASIVSNGSTAILTPHSSGLCTLTVTHPQATYPLTILVRIVTIVENVVVEPSVATVKIAGSQMPTVTTTLSGIDDYNPEEFVWTLDEAGEEFVTYYATGNSCVLSGLKNGVAQLRVSHPKAEYARKILVIVSEQTTSAVDASCYITTSDNYIKLNVDSETKSFTIMLKGGADGDEKYFQWNVENVVGTDVINIETTHGTVSSARSAASYSFGTVHITPVSVGTARITVKHPKSLYSTEILVKVVDSTSHVVSPIYLSAEYNLLQFSSLNTDKKVSIIPVQLPQQRYSEIVWTAADPSICSIVSNGNSAIITSRKEGSTTITIMHPDAENALTMTVRIGSQYIDSIGQTDGEKPAYLTIPDNYVQFSKLSTSRKVTVVPIQLSASKHSNITWTSSDPSICSVIPNGVSATFTALKEGTTTVTVSHPDAENTVIITVLIGSQYTDAGGTPATEAPVYLTIADNVVHFSSLDTKRRVMITPVQLSVNKYSTISWASADPSICSVIPNGASATLTALKEGTTTITVSHPDAENTVIITVKIGAQYTDTGGSPVSANPVYFTISDNVIQFSSLDTKRRVTVIPQYLPINRYSEIIWTAADPSICSVIPNGASATFTALKEGTTTVTVSHPDAENTVIITVKIGAQYTDTGGSPAPLNPVYLAIEYNLVQFSSLNADKIIEITPVQLAENRYSDIIWTVADPSICSVIPNGASATLTALKEGTTTVIVSHPDAENEITITVRIGSQYVDGIGNVDEQQNAYLTIPDNCVQFSTLNTSKKMTVVPVQLAANKYSAINWISVDPSICSVTPNGASATLTALKDGTTSVRVSHPDAENTVIITVRIGSQYVDGIGTDETIPQPVYLTTQENVIQFSSLNTSKIASVTAIRIPDNELSNTKWIVENSSICSVIPNGASATITALKEGTTTISVSHPDAENEITITVRIGSQYVDLIAASPYISVNKEVLEITTDSQAQMISAKLSDESLGGSFSFELDNSTVAEITADYESGTCFIKPIKAGQAELTIRNTKSQYSKSVIIIVNNSDTELKKIQYLTTSSNVVTVSEGNTKTVSVALQNSSETVLSGYSWASDDISIIDIMSSGATAVLNGNKLGTTRVSVSHPNCPYPLEIIVMCVDPIAATANPYIMTSSNIQTLTVSTSWDTITAELIGGTEADAADFTWSATDTSVLQCYGQGATGKVRALQAGTSYVTISHPKAAYSSQILFVCDEAAASNCYISVPESIITMKPTSGAKTVTASLVNGIAEDKYNFTWQLDVYDVVDLNYSANIASITPISQGECTLTISHPKSGFDQKVIIKVTEYMSFAFATTNKTVQQGTTAFINMQVPVTAVPTYIEYSTSNDKVCTILGTDAICQITGIAAGTTTVTARLIATNSNIEQAVSTMLVAVSPAETALTYITTSQTIYTLEKGMNTTLSASIVGADVIATDQYNLSWTSSNPEIVQIKTASSTGVGSGQNVYIEAVESGEAVITVTHPKSNTNLEFYIIVPGSAVQTISLNKTFVTIEKGSNTEITATITDAKSSDYSAITWTIDKVDGIELARCLGSGKTVSIYALAAGTACLKANLPNGSYAECDINIEEGKSFTFAMQTVRLEPGNEKTVGYTVTPSSAGLTWLQSTDSYFTFYDDQNGSVKLTGIKEGTSTLTCVTSYGNKATLQVVCSWDYAFTTDSIKIQGTPASPYIIKYTVNPSNAVIEVPDSDLYYSYINTGTQTITITPRKEGKETLRITATNPANNQVFSTKTCDLVFAYSQLTPVIKVVGQNGSFSSYDSNSGILYLGDGENMELNFSIQEQNVEWSIVSAVVTKKQSGSPVEKLAGTTSNSFVINHPTDYIEQEYLIPVWYDPYYYALIGYDEDDDPVYSGTPTFLDPKLDIYWHFSSGNALAKPKWQLKSSLTEDILSRATNKRNIRMSKSNFEGTAWYYQPYHEFANNGFKSAGPWEAQPTGNQPAELVPVIDNTLKSSVFSDILELIIRHNGIDQNLQIPIYTQTRACTFNY